MSPRAFEIPLLRAAVWFEEAPQPEMPMDSFFDPSVGTADVAYVAPLYRRRLGRLARGMLHCAGRICPEPRDMRVVFASRHGEMERTVAVLRDLALGAELSPTLFSLSVHNSVAGLWSILKENRGPSTALAAGPETFGWGLLDAFAAIEEDPSKPVLFVFGDDRLPDLFQPYAPAEVVPHALALLLGGPAERTLTVTWDSEAVGEPSNLPQSLHFLRALGDSEPQPWRGRGGTWHWHVR